MYVIGFGYGARFKHLLTYLCMKPITTTCWMAFPNRYCSQKWQVNSTSHFVPSYSDSTYTRIGVYLLTWKGSDVCVAYSRVCIWHSCALSLETEVRTFEAGFLITSQYSLYGRCLHRAGNTEVINALHIALCEKWDELCYYNRLLLTAYTTLNDQCVYVRVHRCSTYCEVYLAIIY